MAASARSTAPAAGTAGRRLRSAGPLTAVWLGLLLTVAAAFPVPPTARADLPEPPYLGPPAGFGVAETEHFRVFAQEGAAMDAGAFAIAYGPTAERAHAELGTLFPPPAGKLDLYVYADDTAFAAATRQALRPDPRGREVVADPGVGDLALSLPRFAARSPREAENGLRHAVAQVLVRRLARGGMPRGFDAGIAAYVERPVGQELARIAALLQHANQRDALLSWSDLNRSQPPTADPDLVAAHAYGMVAFLVERYGLRKFGEFVAALAAEPDWRAALRAVYQRSPSELEAQWRENLPRWTAGEWRQNLVAAFDLEPAQALLAKAHYAAAKTELERSLRLYADLGDAGNQARVEDLIRQGDLGLQAEALMTQTQEALERHTYDRAQTLVEQARAQYAQLPPEQRPTALLDAYAELAGGGLQATTDLDEAQRLSHRWADYPEARAAAVDAGSAFARLGDEKMMRQAETVLADLDDRQRRLVLMLGALAALTIAWLVLWLWARGPSELEWG
jgi:hypothetical protein